MILGVGATAQTAFSMTPWGLPVLAPALRSDYSLSLPQVGVVLASANIGLLAAMLVWGLAADRFGERVVIAAGLGVASLCLLAAARTSAFLPFVTLVFGAGVGGASVNAASGRAILGWFPPAQRGFALGVRQMAQPLGGVIAALVLPVAVEVGGVELAISTLGCVCAVAAVAAAVWLRDPAAADPAAARSRRHPLRNPQIWRLAVGSGLLTVPQFGIGSFIVVFLHERHGMSTHAAGGVLGTIDALGVALRLVSGIVSDRLRKRMLPLRAVTLALSLAVAAVIPLLDAPTVWIVPALIVCGGLSLSWNALSYTATAEIAGRGRSGAALGLQQSVLAAGAGLTPLLLAPLIAATSWSAAYALIAAAPLLAFALFSSVGESFGVEQAAQSA